MRDSAVSTSAVLLDLLRRAPDDRVSLAWLMGNLRGRSFGIVILLLALVAAFPGGSMLGGPLIAIPAVQMMLGRSHPGFPRFVGEREFGTARLASLIRRAVPVLRRLEKVVRPRWRTPLQATRRVVGGVVLLLGVLLLAPVPLSNTIPALVIMLIAFAHLEEDGILLCAALAAAVGVLATAGAAIWAFAREGAALAS